MKLIIIILLLSISSCGYEIRFPTLKDVSERVCRNCCDTAKTHISATFLLHPDSISFEVSGKFKIDTTIKK